MRVRKKGLLSFLLVFVLVLTSVFYNTMPVGAEVDYSDGITKTSNGITQEYGKSSLTLKLTNVDMVLKDGREVSRGAAEDSNKILIKGEEYKVKLTLTPEIAKIDSLKTDGEIYASVGNVDKKQFNDMAYRTKFKDKIKALFGNKELIPIEMDLRFKAGEDGRFNSADRYITPIHVGGKVKYKHHFKKAKSYPVYFDADFVYSLLLKVNFVEEDGTPYYPDVEYQTVPYNTVIADSKINIPEVPNKTDPAGNRLAFAGWQTLDGKNIDINKDKITDNITLKPRFEELKTVKFIATEGSKFKVNNYNAFDSLEDLTKGRLITNTDKEVTFDIVKGNAFKAKLPSVVIDDEYYVDGEAWSPSLPDSINDDTEIYTNVKKYFSTEFKFKGESNKEKKIKQGEKVLQLIKDRKIAEKYSNYISKWIYGTEDITDDSAVADGALYEAVFDEAIIDARIYEKNGEKVTSVNDYQVKAEKGDDLLKKLDADKDVKLFINDRKITWLYNKDDESNKVKAGTLLAGDTKVYGIIDTSNDKKPNYVEVTVRLGDEEFVVSVEDNGDVLDAILNDGNFVDIENKDAIEWNIIRDSGNEKLTYGIQPEKGMVVEGKFPKKQISVSVTLDNSANSKGDYTFNIQVMEDEDVLSAVKGYKLVQKLAGDADVKWYVVKAPENKELVEGVKPVDGMSILGVVPKVNEEVIINVTIDNSANGKGTSSTSLIVDKLVYLLDSLMKNEWVSKIVNKNDIKWYNITPTGETPIDPNALPENGMGVLGVVPKEQVVVTFSVDNVSQAVTVDKESALSKVVETLNRQINDDLKNALGDRLDYWAYDAEGTNKAEDTDIISQDTRLFAKMKQSTGGGNGDLGGGGGSTTIEDNTTPLSPKETTDDSGKTLDVNEDNKTPLGLKETDNGETLDVDEDNTTPLGEVPEDKLAPSKGKKVTAKTEENINVNEDKAPLGETNKPALPKTGGTAGLAYVVLGAVLTVVGLKKRKER